MRGGASLTLTSSESEKKNKARSLGIQFFFVHGPHLKPFTVDSYDLLPYPCGMCVMSGTGLDSPYKLASQYPFLSL